jgi:uncharacterized protein with HEPN domain
MSNPKRPDFHLETALVALRRVPAFLGSRTLSEYMTDAYCQSAVERQLEIAGDALGQLRKLDAALFDQIPDGSAVVAFRNVLAHGYATLDHRRVYELATERVSPLLETVEKLLRDLPEGVP